MPKAKAFHVIPHDGVWAVRNKTSGSMRVFETKSAAIDDARKRAREQHDASRIVVHGRSGQIIQNTAVKSGLTDKTIREVVRSVNKAQNGDSARRKYSGPSKVMRASKR